MITFQQFREDYNTRGHKLRAALHTRDGTLHVGNVGDGHMEIIRQHNLKDNDLDDSNDNTFGFYHMEKKKFIPYDNARLVNRGSAPDFFKKTFPENIKSHRLWHSSMNSDHITHKNAHKSIVHVKENSFKNWLNRDNHMHEYSGV